MRTEQIVVAVAAVAAGQALLFASPAMASATAPTSAEITDGARSQAKAVCTSAAFRGVRGGLYLWRCPTGYHGQIVGGVKGDQLYLRSAAGTITQLRTLPASGNYNTGTVGDYGGPWAACLKVPNGPQYCTAHAW